MAELLATLPQLGSVRWIGLRPARQAVMQEVQRAATTVELGLTGDRYAGRDGKRQVTLIQHEHLGVLTALLGIDVTAAMLRRNIAVSGINLLALKDKKFKAGEAVLEFTGLCHPCSRMEEILGAGGYNAMRGHGGINARVVEPGMIAVGSSVAAFG